MPGQALRYQAGKAAPPPPWLASPGLSGTWSASSGKLQTSSTASLHMAARPLGDRFEKLRPQFPDCLEGNCTPCSKFGIPRTGQALGCQARGAVFPLSLLASPVPATNWGASLGKLRPLSHSWPSLGGLVPVVPGRRISALSFMTGQAPVCQAGEAVHPFP